MTAAFTTRPAPPEALSYFTDAHHDDGPFSAVEVRANGVLGLIYKATQGVTFRDPRFVAAMAQCAAAGLLRGAYHFASGTSDAVAQADAFMRVVDTIPSHDDVLLCLDLEGALDSPKTMTTPDAVRFVERVHAVTGRWPLLYAGASKLRERARLDPGAITELARCRLWLAQYGERPKLADIPDAWPVGFDAWQYTDGAVGPSDRVTFPRAVLGFERAAQDRSVYLGDAAGLRRWWMESGR